MEEEERETVVEIKHMSFAFSTSDGRKKRVLHDINLQVQKGSRVLIMYAPVYVCLCC